MAQVELARTAVEDLDRMIQTHSLPHDTRDRFRRSLEQLQQFPLIGHEISGRWEGFRFILGPWRWMIVVYRVNGDNDGVTVVTVQDARSAHELLGD